MEVDKKGLKLAESGIMLSKIGVGYRDDTKVLNRFSYIFDSDDTCTENEVNLSEKMNTLNHATCNIRIRANLGNK